MHTILLADDSSTIRKIVELTFEGTDIRVEAFDSGADALAALDRIRPDLVLADVVMEGPTGYALCERIKASGRPIPVVLLSSAFEPYDAQRAAACGADRHLVKPFESGLLVETVRALLQAPAPAPVRRAPAAETPDEPAPDAAPPIVPEDLDERLIEAVSREVVRRLSERVVREIARDVVPDLAERIIRERIRQLEDDTP